MITYAFQLGRVRDLCLEELKSLLGEENLVDQSHAIALFKIEELSPGQTQRLQDRLGGTIKIIQVTDILSTRTNQTELESKLSPFLREMFKDHKGKVNFSINIFKYKNNYQIKINKLLNFSKKILKSLKLNARFVNIGDKNPKTSTIYKAKVLTKGVDINLVYSKSKLYLGPTVSIQNINAYSKRDFDKPVRDMKVGMLPPKLSQILINLAGKKSEILYDPFCGTGTILAEGLLMKKKVIGSDISPKMIEASNTNIEWLSRIFKTSKANKIFIQDATKITPELIKKITSDTQKIDAIVTEGYLGPPLSKAPHPEHITTFFQEIATLYKKWLTAITRSTTHNIKIVTCAPALKTKSKIHHIPKLQEIISSAGLSLKKQLIYQRADQFVVRDVLVLEKEKK